MEDSVECLSVDGLADNLSMYAAENRLDSSWRDDPVHQIRLYILNNFLPQRLLPVVPMIGGRNELDDIVGRV